MSGVYEFTIIKSVPDILKTHRRPKRAKPSKCKVRFSEDIIIHSVPSRFEEDRSIGPHIPRGLKYRWQSCQETVFEQITPHLINKVFNPVEDETPLKISDSTKGWWEDETPTEFLDNLMSGKIDIRSLAREIDSIIESTLEFNRPTPIRLTFDSYQIDIRSAMKMTLTE